MLLPAFQQSVFLQALGWAIANSIWQGGILWIFYKTIIAFYNNSSSGFKNNLSTALLLGNFLWFVITFSLKVFHLNNGLPDHVANQVLYYNPEFVSGNTGFLNFIHPVVFTLPYLSVAYLLLLLFFSVRLVNAYRIANFIRSNGLSRPGAEWGLFVEKVANHIRITKKIKIWFSKYVDVPATIGFLKPVILIPFASLNQLTTDQMEAIILHEISHIKRNDYLVNLFVSLVETILFFNPFVVLFGRIIKKERENCCDDFVLQYQYDRHSYASALLVLEQSRDQQFRLAIAATSGRKQLLFRIKRIMEIKKNSDGLNYGQKLLALVVSTGIICSIAWLTPEKKTHQASEKQLEAKTLIHRNLNSPAKTSDNSITLKNQAAKNITLFNQPQIPKDEQINIEETNEEDMPETYKSSGNNDDDAFTLNIKNPENKDEIFKRDTHNNSNKISQSIDPADLEESDATAISNFTFSPNSILSYLKKFEDFHLNIDAGKLRVEIEKGNQVLATMDWPAIKNQLNETLRQEDSELPGFKMNIKNNKLEFTTEKKALTENLKKEFDLQTAHSRNDLKRRIRPLKRDSLISYNNKNEADFYYNEARRNHFTVPSPPPLPPFKIKKAVADPPPSLRPIIRQAYAFEYKNASPKVSKHIPSIGINYEDGAITINGETIKLSELKKSQAEKIIRKFIIEDDKHSIETHRVD
ncbi:MAG: M56 family metallopeptidase [Ginsengibacter sp.]